MSLKQWFRAQAGYVTEKAKNAPDIVKVFVITAPLAVGAWEIQHTVFGDKAENAARKEVKNPHDTQPDPVVPEIFEERYLDIDISADYGSQDTTNKKHGADKPPYIEKTLEEMFLEMNR
jgi:hypothetical protein